MTRLLLAILVLGLTRCAGPARTPEATLFDEIARLRATYDAALDSEDRFRVDVEASTLTRLVRENFGEVLSGLGSPEAARQEAAAFALGFSRNRAALDPLAAAAVGPNKTLRAFALAALGMLGFRDVPQEPFRKALADESWQVRLAALFGLRHCAGPGTPSWIVEALQGCLSDPLTGVRNETVLVLAKIGGAAPLEMILARAVRDPEALVRKNAARALAEVGGPAERIVPALNELRRDQDPGVAETAESALRYVESRRVDTPALDR